MAWKAKQKQEVICSLVGAKPVVVIDRLSGRKINVLMNTYPNQEWMGYLVGDSDDKAFKVTDLTIPPHKIASGGMAEAEPFNTPEHCIGVIHSHHHMGAFHSGVDDSYVDRNWPVSITVDSRGKFDAVSFKATPCGQVCKQDKLEVRLVDTPDDSLAEFLKQAQENINKPNKGRTRISIMPVRSEPILNGGKDLNLSESRVKSIQDNIWEKLDGKR